MNQIKEEIPLNILQIFTNYIPYWDPNHQYDISILSVPLNDLIESFYSKIKTASEPDDYDSQGAISNAIIYLVDKLKFCPYIYQYLGPTDQENGIEITLRLQLYDLTNFFLEQPLFVNQQYVMHILHTMIAFSDQTNSNQPQFTSIREGIVAVYAQILCGDANIHLQLNENHGKLNEQYLQHLLGLTKPMNTSSSSPTSVTASLTSSSELLSLTSIDETVFFQIHICNLMKLYMNKYLMINAEFDSLELQQLLQELINGLQTYFIRKISQLIVAQETKNKNNNNSLVPMLLTSFVKGISKTILQLSLGNALILYTGWKRHAVFTRIKRLEEDQFEVAVFNLGEGSEEHETFFSEIDDNICYKYPYPLGILTKQAWEEGKSGFNYIYEVLNVTSRNLSMEKTKPIVYDLDYTIAETKKSPTMFSNYCFLPEMEDNLFRIKILQDNMKYNVDSEHYNEVENMTIFPLDYTKLPYAQEQTVSNGIVACYSAACQEVFTNPLHRLKEEQSLHMKTKGSSNNNDNNIPHTVFLDENIYICQKLHQIKPGKLGIKNMFLAYSHKTKDNGEFSWENTNKHFIEPDISQGMYSVPLSTWLDQSVLKSMNSIENNSIMILQGDAGIGKSSSLFWIADQLWETYHKNINNSHQHNNHQKQIIIPIYIRLSQDLTKNISSIATFIAKETGITSLKLKETLISHYQFVFLLDGYDELSETKQQTILQDLQIADWPGITLLTCRNNVSLDTININQSNSFIKLQNYFLQEWKNEQIIAYLKKHLIFLDIQTLIETYGSNLLELIRSPLLLYMFLNTYEFLEEIKPINKFKIYSLYHKHKLIADAKQVVELLHKNSIFDITKNQIMELIKQILMEISLQTIQLVTNQHHNQNTLHSLDGKNHPLPQTMISEYLPIKTIITKLIRKEFFTLSEENISIIENAIIVEDSVKPNSTSSSTTSASNSTEDKSYSFMHISFLEYYVSLALIESIITIDEKQNKRTIDIWSHVNCLRSQPDILLFLQEYFEQHEKTKSCSSPLQYQSPYQSPYPSPPASPQRNAPQSPSKQPHPPHNLWIARIELYKEKFLWMIKESRDSILLGNILTLFVKCGIIIENLNLSNLTIVNANLDLGIFQHVDFRGTKFLNCSFLGCCFDDCDFSGVIMDDLTYTDIIHYSIETHLNHIQKILLYNQQTLMLFTTNLVIKINLLDGTYTKNYINDAYYYISKENHQMISPKYAPTKALTNNTEYYDLYTNKIIESKELETKNISNVLNCNPLFLVDTQENNAFSSKFHNIPRILSYNHSQYANIFLYAHSYDNNQKQENKSKLTLEIQSNENSSFYQIKPEFSWKNIENIIECNDEFFLSWIAEDSNHQLMTIKRREIKENVSNEKKEIVDDYNCLSNDEKSILHIRNIHFFTNESNITFANLQIISFCLSSNKRYLLIKHRKLILGSNINTIHHHEDDKDNEEVSLFSISFGENHILQAKFIFSVSYSTNLMHTNQFSGKDQYIIFGFQHEIRIYSCISGNLLKTLNISTMKTSVLLTMFVKLPNNYSESHNNLSESILLYQEGRTSIVKIDFHEFLKLPTHNHINNMIDMNIILEKPLIVSFKRTKLLNRSNDSFYYDRLSVFKLFFAYHGAILFSTDQLKDRMLRDLDTIPKTSILILLSGNIELIQKYNLWNFKIDDKIPFLCYLIQTLQIEDGYFDYLIELLYHYGQGTDMNMKDHHDASVLDYAMRKGYKKTCQTLLQCRNIEYLHNLYYLIDQDNPELFPIFFHKLESDHRENIPNKKSQLKNLLLYLEESRLLFK